MRRVVRLVILALALGATVPSGGLAAGTATGSHVAGTPTGPRIVALYPNPLTGGDRGEYVRLRLPAGNWTLSDGESAVRLASDGGYVVVTASASALPNGTSGTVHKASLALANAGEQLTLKRGNASGDLVDAVSYENAPEGELWIRARERHWLPLGFHPREAVSVGPTNATVFVLPDAPNVAIETLRGATSRILLGAYTYESDRVTDVLVAAADRGVTVRVLVDGAPVGGMSERQARLLDRLVEAGVEVRVLGGRAARFRFHHAKYAVVDDTVLVMTENWKPSGVGGAGNRGWGVRLESATAADEVAEVFAHDFGWRDARSWRTYRIGESFTDDTPVDGSYPTLFEPKQVHVENVTILTAPGNARAAVIAVIDSAEHRLDIIQPTIEAGPLLAATRRAAGRGVEVRILLSGMWYVREENEALVERLNGWAERNNVPLKARIADPAGRYAKIHAKGVIADDTVIVGSMNWNPTSARENREVAVALHGRDVAAYYRRVFEADWRAGGGTVPHTFWIAGVGATAGVVLYASRRIEFA